MDNIALNAAKKAAISNSVSDPQSKIGLALSGGVMRGPVHVGVLNVLEREGIPVDVVTGASAGAIVGEFYCAGMELDYMQELVMKIGWKNFISPTISSKGFFSFGKLENWLIDLVTDLHFCDLNRQPFAVVATDLEKGKPVVFTKGSIAPAVRASCSVPGVIVPAEIDGKLLGDGGVSNNLPVSAATALGADYVIGVDLFIPAVRRVFGPLGFGFAALETLVRRSGGGDDIADCLIAPDLAGKSYINPDKAELMKLGEKATETKLPEIFAALESRR
ncbi:MAG TPA: patatin-like phospholipase family protein [Chloroflexi bacterium]|nr:patatin-like phospholipase family protein [Chloroflexota bacterium]